MNLLGELRRGLRPFGARLIDEAMTAIERDNPSLKGVLPKDYARPGLDKQRLGQIINLVSDIGLGGSADRAGDILGRVYEYSLAEFASAEGKKGSQFYTPSRVVRVLVGHGRRRKIVGCQDDALPDGRSARVRRQAPMGRHPRPQG